MGQTLGRSRREYLLRPRGLWALAACAAAVLGGSPANAQTAYVTNADDMTVSVIDVARNRVIASLEVDLQPRDIAVAPDGRRILVSHDEQQTVLIIDAVDDVLLQSIELWDSPTNVAWSPDGAFAYVVITQADDVAVIDAETGDLVAIVPVGDEPASIAFSPDGTRAYVTNMVSGGVSVIDVASRSVLATIPLSQRPGRDAPFDIGVTPDGARVVVSQPWADSVSVIDTATNAVVTTIPVGRHPRGLAITPDGSRVYVANHRHAVSGHPSLGPFTVSVIDIAKAAVVSTVSVGLAAPDDLAITPDGRRILVTGLNSGRVAVIDAVSATSSLLNDNGASLSPAAVAVAPDRSRGSTSRPGLQPLQVVNAPRSGWTRLVEGFSTRPGPSVGQLWVRAAPTNPDFDDMERAEILTQVDCGSRRVRALQAVVYSGSEFSGPFEALPLEDDETWQVPDTSDPLLPSIVAFACRG